MDDILKHIAVVDVEATGIDPRACSMLSIGAVYCANGKINTYYRECAAFEGALVEEQALRVNGFSKESVFSKDRMQLQDLVKEFLNLMDSNNITMIAGQNPKFDRDFIGESAKRYGIECKLDFHTIDMHSIFWGMVLSNGMEIPLDEKGYFKSWAGEIYTALGLPLEPRPHNALTGARIEFEALCRMIYKRSVMEEYNKYPLKLGTWF